MLGKCISKPHLMPVRMALIKKTNRFWDVEKRKPSFIADRIVSRFSHYENSMKFPENF